MFMLILMLVGNSLEIGCKMKIGFLVRRIREFEKKVTGYLREKVGFQFISGLFSGVIGITLSQYTTYFRLGPITG